MNKNVSCRFLTVVSALFLGSVLACKSAPQPKTTAAPTWKTPLWIQQPLNAFTEAFEQKGGRVTVVYSSGLQGKLAGSETPYRRLGGLETRREFLQNLKTAATTLSSSLIQLESGNIFAEAGQVTPEAAHKGAAALAELGLHAIGLGETDLELGIETLVALAAQYRLPFICSNLVEKKSGKTVFAATQIIPAADHNIGIIAITDPSLLSKTVSAALQKQGYVWLDPVKAVKQQIAALQGRTSFNILMLHTRWESAKKWAAQAETVRLVIAGHENFRTIIPEAVPPRFLVEVPQDGVYLGLAQLILRPASTDLKDFSNLLARKQTRDQLVHVAERGRSQAMRQRLNLEDPKQADNFFKSQIDDLNKTISAETAALKAEPAANLLFNTVITLEKRRE